MKSGIRCLALYALIVYLASMGVAPAQLKVTLEGHTEAVAFSPDGSILAISSRAILLWDMETGQYKGSLGQDIIGPVALVFSPDGTMLASGSYDNLVRLLILPPLKCLLPTFRLILTTSLNQSRLHRLSVISFN